MCVCDETQTDVTVGVPFNVRWLSESCINLVERKDSFEHLGGTACIIR